MRHGLRIAQHSLGRCAARQPVFGRAPLAGPPPDRGGNLFFGALALHRAMFRARLRLTKRCNCRATA
jgi:hypothetical protein